MLSRRALLGSTAGLAAAGLAGCTGDSPLTPRERPTPVPQNSLPAFRSIGGATLLYEEDRQPREFHLTEGFHTQLEAWYAEWAELSGQSADRIRSYGTWTDAAVKGTSWHNTGRAFDLCALVSGGTVLASMRRDQWPNPNDPALLRPYWGVAASLHLHFAYVLTYLYDANHSNHIHIDNSVSGTGASTFTGRSKVQNQAVQAISTQVWGRPTPSNGSWDSATQREVRYVLRSRQLGEDLTEQPVWQAYLRASVRRAYGTDQ